MFRVYAITDIGLERVQNQDGFMVDGISCVGETHREIYYETDAPYLHVAVADGVGSTRYAAFAVEKMWEYLTDHLRVDENNLEPMILGMNQYVFSELQKYGKGDGAGTITGLLINGDKSLFYNIGDSLAFSINNGYLEQQTVEDTAHALFGESMSRDEDGFQIKSPLLQSIGTKQTLDLIHIKKIYRADTFLLCSDGVTDLLSLDEIEDILDSGSSLNEISQKIICEANEHGGYDNSTLIIVTCEGE